MSRVITLGGDYEFFQIKEDKVVPATLTTSDKRIDIDGYQGEIHPKFNTCREILISRIHGLVQYKKNMDFSRIIYEIPQKEYNSLNKEQKELGCKPELSAYTNDIIPKPTETRIRSTGGHMHIGYKQEIHFYTHTFHKSDSEYRALFYDTHAPLKNGTGLIKKETIDNSTIVKYFDATVGIIDTILHPKDKIEAERLRRTIYGEAGAYRNTYYGVEYRVLSSWYIIHPVLVSLYYGLARSILLILLSKRTSAKYKEIIKDSDRIRNIINNVDRTEALNFFKEHLSIYKALFYHYTFDTSIEYLYYLIYKNLVEGDLEETLTKMEYSKGGSLKGDGIRTIMSGNDSVRDRKKNKRYNELVRWLNDTSGKEEES